MRLREGAIWAAACAAGLAADAASGPPAADVERLAGDVPSLLETARSAPVLPAFQMEPAHYWSTRDCARFAFPADGPARSEPVWLRSTEYVRECRRGGGFPFPDDGRRGPPGWRDCWERPVFTHSKRVQMEIQGRRPNLPWESETFEICLQGPVLSFHPIAAAYEYQARQGPEGFYALTPVRKIAMDPDPEGITAGPLSNTGTSFVMDFQDRWASEYGPGEITWLHVELFRSYPNWFDQRLVEAKIPLPSAPSYSVDFGRYGLKLEPGKQYYVKWGFQREGAASRPTLMRRGATPRAVFRSSAG